MYTQIVGRIMPTAPRKSSVVDVRFLLYAACAVVVLALLSQNSQAFESSLQPEQIEAAYALGQTSNHEELAGFLKQYERDFEYPANHPVAYVQSVEFQTPYEQIVLRSKQAGATYDKFRAAEEYHANPRLVVLRVVVALRLNYGGPVPDADSYDVSVSQDKPITPRTVRNTVLCDPYSQISYPYSVNRDCSVYARELVLNFDAREFTQAQIKIKVRLPNDQSLETKFNPDALK